MEEKEESMREETRMEEESMREETRMEEESMREETHMEEETTDPVIHIVDMPPGTSVPGCEETNECYLPADITINAGETVEWVNIDTAAHTVTSGSPSEGPSHVFDSSLVLGNESYSFTFEEAGTYDYYCMIHPWMAGNVIVN